MRGGMTNNGNGRDEKSGSGDQSGAASHKAGDSPEGEKSDSTKVLDKKRSAQWRFVDG